jgi:hypothetical protein
MYPRHFSDCLAIIARNFRNLARIDSRSEPLRAFSHGRSHIRARLVVRTTKTERTFICPDLRLTPMTGRAATFALYTEELSQDRQ